MADPKDGKDPSNNMEWVRAMIAMEEELGTFPPGGAGGGSVASWRRSRKPLLAVLNARIRALHEKEEKP